VVKILRVIWDTKTETAKRVRGRIESVLDWATANGFLSGENPARWAGHLENVLPKQKAQVKVVHHVALPFTEAPDFMTRLAKIEGTAARALQVLILTATRVGELLGLSGARSISPKQCGRSRLNAPRGIASTVIACQFLVMR
jgi:integrase